jgi:inward rectifier potassium channel
MALSRPFRPRRHLESKEVGFGKTENVQQRLMNPDGSYNFVRIGLPWYESFNFYHFLISLSWFKFIGVIVIWYTVMNLIFTGLYCAFCIENLTGMVYRNDFERFMEIYFFSAQTLTTVGYGRINPMGFTAGSIASLEALVGLLSFALFTGLLYARFAKPNAVLMFSKNALFSPFNNGIGLMFRVANQLNSNLMNMKVQITLSIMEEDDKGNTNRRFFTPLNLERDNIIFFPSSWTVVHPIDEASPLFGYAWEDLHKLQPELLILASGFDESFNENVHARYSYSFINMVWGAKFIKILGANDSGMPLVDLGKLNDYDKVVIEQLVGKV